MVKLLIHLLDDLSADLLVLSGLVTLAVAIIGNVSDKADPSQGRRLMLSLIGCLFVALGFLVHSNHELTASADASNSPAPYSASAAALDPASATFSPSAVDKYLGRPSDLPAYFGQMQVTVAAFLGTWTNLGEAGHNQIHRIRIVADGDHLLVHGWGMCEPVDCDWGEQPAVLNHETARVTFKMGSPAWQFTLVPMPSGELQIEVVWETAGRPNHHHAENLFAKSN
ncbi:MAG: hypothetical protein ACRD3T_10830 [Terriglobia bacterium]